MHPHWQMTLMHIFYMFKQGSFDSQLDVISNNGSSGGGGAGGITSAGGAGTSSSAGFRPSMLRSHTDSRIDYSGADESEAPGSVFYITREGGIDYEVVMLAVYMVFKRESNVCSLRVLETGLNITEVLLDLGVVKNSENAHHLAMGIIKRTLLHLGCPHGCNDGMSIDISRRCCLELLTLNIICLFNLSQVFAGRNPNFCAPNVRLFFHACCARRHPKRAHIFGKWSKHPNCMSLWNFFTHLSVSV